MAVSQKLKLIRKVNNIQDSRLLVSGAWIPPDSNLKQDFGFLELNPDSKGLDS